MPVGGSKFELEKTWRVTGVGTTTLTSPGNYTVPYGKQNMYVSGKGQDGLPSSVATYAPGNIASYSPGNIASYTPGNLSSYTPGTAATYNPSNALYACTYGNVSSYNPPTVSTYNAPVYTSAYNNPIYLYDVYAFVTIPCYNAPGNSGQGVICYAYNYVSSSFSPSLGAPFWTGPFFSGNCQYYQCTIYQSYPWTYLYYYTAPGNVATYAPGNASAYNSPYNYVCGYNTSYAATYNPATATYNPATAATYNSPTVASYNPPTAATYNAATTGSASCAFGITMPGGVAAPASLTSESEISYYSFPDNATYPVNVAPGGCVVIKSK
jgi:hypothetical protein